MSNVIPMINSAEQVIRMTKAALATILQPEDLVFLDSAMRTYASHVVYEWETHRDNARTA